MDRSTLHYFYDPLCGWCYGAAPLLAVARDMAGVDLVLHGGGLMTGSNRQPVTPALRQYVMQHDQRIATLSGQPFGRAYFDDLLQDTSAVFDSEPPTTAVLAAEALGGRGAELLPRLQRAHYVEGRRISEPAVLQALAVETGFAADAYADACARLSGAPTQQHIADSRRLLAAAGGRGFPTFAVARDGDWQIVDVAPFLGQPSRWRDALQSLLSSH
jgi:putative protein-disulfide isomerase